MLLFDWWLLLNIWWIWSSTRIMNTHEGLLSRSLFKKTQILTWINMTFIFKKWVNFFYRYNLSQFLSWNRNKASLFGLLHLSLLDFSQDFFIRFHSLIGIGEHISVVHHTRILRLQHFLVWLILVSVTHCKCFLSIKPFLQELQIVFRIVYVRRYIVQFIISCSNVVVR